MGRRNRADDVECVRLHRLASALYFVTRGWTRHDAKPGDAVVVIDGTARGGAAANAVGTLVEYLPRTTRRRETWVIRTRRGVAVRWTNCVVAPIDRIDT